MAWDTSSVIVQTEQSPITGSKYISQSTINSACHKKGHYRTVSRCHYTPALLWSDPQRLSATVESSRGEPRLCSPMQG